LDLIFVSSTHNCSAQKSKRPKFFLTLLQTTTIELIFKKKGVVMNLYSAYHQGFKFLREGEDNKEAGDYFIKWYPVGFIILMTIFFLILFVFL